MITSELLSGASAPGARPAGSGEDPARGDSEEAVVGRAAAARAADLKRQEKSIYRRAERPGGPSIRVGRASRPPGSRDRSGGAHRARGATPDTLQPAVVALRRAWASTEMPAKRSNRQHAGLCWFMPPRSGDRHPRLGTGSLQAAPAGKRGGWAWRDMRLPPRPPNRVATGRQASTRAAARRAKHALGTGPAGTGLTRRVGGSAPCPRQAPWRSPGRCSSTAAYGGVQAK